MATWCGPDDPGTRDAEIWADSFSARSGPVNEHPGPDFPWYKGQPVMEGDGGRLVYDCEPDSGDGCLIPVPEPEAAS